MTDKHIKRDLDSKNILFTSIDSKENHTRLQMISKRSFLFKMQMPNSMSVFIR